MEASHQVVFVSVQRTVGVNIILPLAWELIYILYQSDHFAFVSCDHAGDVWSSIGKLNQ